MTRSKTKRLTRSFRRLYGRCLLAALVASGCGNSTPVMEMVSGTGGASGGAGESGAGGSSGGAGGSGVGGAAGGSSTGAGGGILVGDASMADGPTRDGADGCGQSSVEAKVRIVNILLVIDRSGSMTAKPAGFTTDKWSAMRAALSGALDQVKGGVSLGVELFPNNLTTPIPTACTSQCWDMPPGESAILVPVGPGTTTLPTIIGKLDLMPAGGTPTASALKAASDYFTSGSGKNLAGDKYVLLATDGGPNGNTVPCGASTCTTNMDLNVFATNYCDDSKVPDGSKSCLDERATVDQLTSMAAAGITTFVVGIPGTDPYISTLDAMAVAGGAPAATTSPKYFAVSAMGGVAGLQQVFETITKQLIKSCRLQLQSVPPDLGLLNVYVDRKVVPKPGADGWDLDTSTSPPTVVLKGATCMNVEVNGATHIDVQYGCPTVIIN